MTYKITARLMRVVFLVLSLGFSSTSQTRTQGSDTTKVTTIDTLSTPPVAMTHKDLRFPSLGQRLSLLAIAVFTVGGLGILLNEKRKRADRKAGIT